jgi:glycosyltransferase involved in cell wall biosynthesis
VIPVLDDAELLECCLRALAGQTVSPAEVIVVDNGSTDATAQVAQRFGARLLREPVRGIAAAASRGYDAARSEFIARIDADSVPGRTWVACVESSLSRHSGVGAVTGFAHFVDAPRGLRRPGAFLYLGAYFLLVGVALGHPPLFGSNFAMRRSAWEAVAREAHRTDGFVHDDIDLSVHLGPRFPIRVVPALTLGISARPFTDGGWGLRLQRGIHSLVVHWPRELPWLRWGRLCRDYRSRRTRLDAAVKVGARSGVRA